MGVSDDVDDETPHGVLEVYFHPENGGEDSKVGMEGSPAPNNQIIAGGR